MPPKRSSKVDLKGRYHLFVELGLVGALLFAMIAVSVDYRPDASLDIPQVRDDFSALTPIPITEHLKPKPVPPRPQVPIVVPDDSKLGEEIIPIGEPIEPLTTPPSPPLPPEVKDDVVDFAEIMPELVGGYEALQRQIAYPEIAVKAGVQGRVVVQFIVDKDGSVIDPVVVQRIGAGCDQEALRVISQARFKPGYQNGKPVRVRFTIPVNFKLK